MTRYRCCEHCEEASVHPVEPDVHEGPCDVPTSPGCIGREVTSEEEPA